MLFRYLLLCSHHIAKFWQAGQEEGLACFRERRADLMTGVQEEIDHSVSPSLSQILKEVGQFAQGMGMAQAVLAKKVTIRLPAIVDEYAQQGGQNSQIIERLLATLRMTRHPSQQRGGQNVPPVQRASDTQPRLIGVRHLGDFNGLPDGCHRRSQPDSSLLCGGESRRFSHWPLEEITHQLCRALRRYHVALHQIRSRASRAASP